MPVRVQVQPLSTVTTALLLTAVPPWAFSTMFTVPVKLLPFFRVMVRVEMVSTTMSPVSTCPSAVNSTCAPLLPAVPQPWLAELPTTRSSAPSESSFFRVTPLRVSTQWVLVT